MLELGLSIGAIAVILLLGQRGYGSGFFNQMVLMVIALFAMIVSLRFWYPVTSWFGERLGAEGGQVAFAAFWIVFIFVLAPPYGLLRSLNERVVPVYPVMIERSLGFLCGCVTGAIVAGCLFTSLIPYLPNVLQSGFDHRRLLIPIDRAPVAVYRGIEGVASSLGFSTDEAIPLPRLGEDEDKKVMAVWESGSNAK